MAPLRTIFFGTAPFAAVSLQALARAPFGSIELVVSQPDRPQGRHLQPQPTPVKQAALALGLQLAQPEKARDPAFLETLRALKPDLIVVAAYGQILSKALLEIPRFGCLNVHGSLLPKYRGAAPIHWAMLNDQNETGITIMKMDVGLDTGPMVSKVAITIQPEDTGQTLHDRLAALGGELLVRTIPSYVNGELQPAPQDDSQATYASKITKEQSRIMWAEPARAIWNKVRAFTPWPGTFCYEFSRGKKQVLKIISAELDEGEGEPGKILAVTSRGLKIACGRDAICATGLQREGGKKLRSEEFLKGYPLAPGLVLE